MWWKELEESAQQLAETMLLTPSIDLTAKVSPHAIIEGSVYIGPNTIVDHFAIIQGPVRIEANCIIGDGAKVRGPTWISRGVRIGRQCELRNAIIGPRVAIGPQCFVCDSIVEEEAYLGAMVRTSNQMLNRSNARSLYNGKIVDTGLSKLGAFIGARAELGIQVVILPGRVVPAGSLFGPHITIDKNYEPGRYTLKQVLDHTPIN